MKIKTSGATGSVLDWLVAMCEGHSLDADTPLRHYSPSTRQEQGGPIIEREQITTKRYHYSTQIADIYGGDWLAYRGRGTGPHVNEFSMWGPTPRIAAMRCYVASKLGDEVEVPDCLLSDER